jgi:superfamily II DNA/RNA helicase
VFTRTKHGADKVVRGLLKAGIAADAIHGNKSQGRRERVLAAFRKGEVRTLVATDIAARGIDVDGISHVVNFDLPNVPETYVHRIGRTARAGAQGVAISLCDPEETAFLRDIEKLIRMGIPATDRSTRGLAQRPNGHSERMPAAPGRTKQRRRPNGAHPHPTPTARQQDAHQLAAIPFLRRGVAMRRDHEQRPSRDHIGG